MRSLVTTCVLLCACTGEQKTHRDLGPALNLLQSANVDDRFEAVVQLGEDGSEKAREGLQGAIRDEDAAVRLLAGIALVAVDANIVGETIETRELPDGASLLTPNPEKLPVDALDVGETLVYSDPWFAGTLLPGALLAACDKDERVRKLALRALEVLGKRGPRNFRDVVARATKD